jgi:hypothetical protein
LENQKDNHKVKREQKKTDFQTVFLSEHGKRVMKELEKFCFFESITTVPNDPFLSVFNDGRRSVILYIRKLIKES